jgi:hypothetical protein
MSKSYKTDFAQARCGDFEHIRFSVKSVLAFLEHEAAWRLSSAPCCDGPALHRTLELIAEHRRASGPAAVSGALR